MFDWLRKLFVGAEQKLDVNKDGKVDSADAKVIIEKAKEEVKETVAEVKEEVKKAEVVVKETAKKATDRAKSVANKVKSGRPKKNG